MKFLVLIKNVLSLNSDLVEEIRSGGWRKEVLFSTVLLLFIIFLKCFRFEGLFNSFLAETIGISASSCFLSVSVIIVSYFLFSLLFYFFLGNLFTGGFFSFFVCLNILNPLMVVIQVVFLFVGEYLTSSFSLVLFYFFYILFWWYLLRIISFYKKKKTLLVFLIFILLAVPSVFFNGFAGVAPSFLLLTKGVF